MLSLTSARDLAAQAIQKSQERYKRNYDRRSTYTTTPWRVGDWVMVHMPQRKLSRPWHGPFRISSVSDPDVLLTKVYFPQDRDIHVHQSRVKVCPPQFPAGFFWYGGRRRGPGRPPRWVSEMLDTHVPADPVRPGTTPDSGGLAVHPADGTTDDAADDPACAPPPALVEGVFDRRLRPMLDHLRTVPRGLLVSTPYGTDVRDELNHRGE